MVKMELQRSTVKAIVQDVGVYQISDKALDQLCKVLEDIARETANKCMLNAYKYKRKRILNCDIDSVLGK